MPTSLPNNSHKKLNSVFPGVNNPENGLIFTEFCVFCVYRKSSYYAYRTKINFLVPFCEKKSGTIIQVFMEAVFNL